MAEIIDERRPLFRVYIVLTGYKLGSDVHPDDFHLGGNAATELL